MFVCFREGSFQDHAHLGRGRLIRDTRVTLVWQRHTGQTFEQRVEWTDFQQSRGPGVLLTATCSPANSWREPKHGVSRIGCGWFEALIDGLDWAEVMDLFNWVWVSQTRLLIWPGGQFGVTRAGFWRKEATEPVYKKANVSFYPLVLRILVSVFSSLNEVLWVVYALPALNPSCQGCTLHP